MNKKLLVVGLLCLGVISSTQMVVNATPESLLQDFLRDTDAFLEEKLMEVSAAREKARAAQLRLQKAYETAYQSLNFDDTSKLILNHGIYTPGQSLEEFKKTNNHTPLALKILCTLGGSSIAGLYGILFTSTDVCKTIFQSLCQESKIIIGIGTGAFCIAFISGLAWSIATHIRNNADYAIYQKMEREGTLPAHYHEIVNLIEQEPFLLNNYY